MDEPNKKDKSLLIGVNRRFPKRYCLVLLCKDRATDKYCFVNLTSQHVCSCRFDTIELAIEDLKSRPEVIDYHIFEHTMPSHEERNPNPGL